jgi:PKD repeat protein
LGSGVNGNLYTGLYRTVNALAADGLGHLFVGGSFSLAGTNVSPYIAQANLLPSAPTILKSPQTQTAEAGATVHLTVSAAGDPPPAYQWYFNGTNLLSCTSSNLVLTNMLFSESGTYTVVVTNVFGAVTSAPMVLNVVPAVERRPVPGVKLMGEAGGLLNVDFANSLSPTPDWLPLDIVALASTSQYYFDLSEPLPPQRYYRAWQTGTPGVLPSLSLLGIVPAITLTGNIGASVRVDYINPFGPIDAWVTLSTVTLTNTSQLYFDVSAPGQPQRLYRLVQVP